MPIQIDDAYRDSEFAQRQTGLLFNLPVPAPGVEPLPEGISLCMIVKNEERFLAECLESVRDVVDEINIVDTGSTDRTVEIARSYGANIIFREWRNDFAWARNESIAMATRRWIIVLDADEELERDSRALLRALRTTPADTTCVYVDIENLVDDQTGIATMSHRLLRVFPNTPRLRFTHMIHESLVLDGGKSEMRGALSPLRILHKGYTTEILHARGKDLRNRPLVSKAYEENTEDLFAMFNYGNAAICAGNVEVGVACLERMLEIAPGIKIYFPLAYVMLAQTYTQELNDPDKALATVERGMLSFPHDAGLIFVRGQILARLGKTVEARELFHKALSMREYMQATAMTDDEMFEWKIFAAMASSYEREQKYGDASEWLARAIANKPSAMYLLRAQAQMLERAGRHYESERTYRRMAEVDPSVGHLELVNYFLRRARYAEAITAVELGMPHETNGVVVAKLNVLAARAVRATGTGDPMTFLTAALARHPACGSALAMMEELLKEAGAAAALDALHLAELDAECRDGDDYCRRSFRLLALDRDAEARDAAQRGLERDHDNRELRFNLAIALMRLGDVERAAAEFAAIDEKDRGIFGQAMQLRASLLLKGGDVAGAEAALERWMSSLPGDADAVVIAGRMLLAAGARTEGKALLERHAGVGRSVALELAGLMMQDGDLAGAGRIAEAALR
jgi:tetratricopeptide (TPR) repeat protein